MTDPPELPEEIAELLSALLDGAVTDAERAEAERWLLRTVAAREEYEALGLVRSGLRQLPAVEPPERFVLHPNRRSRTVAPHPSWWSPPAALVASGIATAAAWALLGGTGGGETLVPPLDDVQAAVVADLPVDGLVEVDDPAVTIVRQDGSVDWSSLPAGARSEVEGNDLWVASGPGPSTVVAERDGAVYTLVSDELGPGELVALVDDLPGSDDSLLTRVRDACETLVDAFSLG